MLKSQFNITVNLSKNKRLTNLLLDFLDDYSDIYHCSTTKNSNIYNFTFNNSDAANIIKPLYCFLTNYYKTKDADYIFNKLDYLAKHNIFSISLFN